MKTAALKAESFGTRTQCLEVLGRLWNNVITKLHYYTPGSLPADADVEEDFDPRARMNRATYGAV